MRVYFVMLILWSLSFHVLLLSRIKRAGGFDKLKEAIAVQDGHE